jgi:hypothetical protein
MGPTNKEKVPSKLEIMPFEHEEALIQKVA